MSFVDLDEAICADAALTVAEIFAREGEAGFRRRELEATRALVGARAAVVATGGGWASNPGAIELLPPGSRMIHLRATPATLVTRMGAASGVRPLLAGADPAAAVAELVARREAAYGRADAEIDTEGMTLQRVTGSVVELASLFRDR